MSAADRPLVEVRDLKVHFPVRGKRHLFVRAVDGVSFTIERGRTFGLVGESGSGKTTIGQALLRLISATAGQVRFDGEDLSTVSPARLRALRSRMQIIFQDPQSSLNPRMTVAGIVAEPLIVHAGLTRTERRGRVGEILERVGLSPQYMSRYPHEFSGGQRQRIGIARALATNPDFIVCDEPVSALDVSIQAQILNLLRDLQKDLGLSYLFIAHNLAVVEHIADTVGVMYLGHIVETADRDTLYADPKHPYTQSLLAAVPEPDPSRRTARDPLPGETPSPISPPRGCPFHPRCLYTRDIAGTLRTSDTATVHIPHATVVRRCLEDRPLLAPVPGAPDHLHACVVRHKEDAKI